MATSKAGQFEGNDHHHTIGITRLHANRGKLRILVVQVENCELPKDFSGPSIIGDEAPVKTFLEEGRSGAHVDVL